MKKLIALTTLLTMILLASPGRAAAEPLSRSSYVYKTIGKTSIALDLHRPKDTKIRPVVVWIHGGALIVGSRVSVPRRLLDLCQKEGYALISIDYRLAPETKLPAIIEDVEDAFRWIHENGKEKLGVDPARMVITGGSAGGYLTMMCGVRIKPRPKALVAYWGYGDVDGEWYVKPSEHYRKIRKLISKEDAWKGVGQGVPTGTPKRNEQQAKRGQFYLYLRQHGLWTQVVSGFDPKTQAEKIHPYCPIRNLHKDYPPILMIHGTKDTDVPYEQSAAMAREMKKQNLKHELITVQDAGHGLSGGDKKTVNAAHDRALAFIREHLK